MIKTRHLNLLFAGIFVMIAGAIGLAVMCERYPYNGERWRIITVYALLLAIFLLGWGSCSTAWRNRDKRDMGAANLVVLSWFAALFSLAPISFGANYVWCAINAQQAWTIPRLTWWTVGVSCVFGLGAVFARVAYRPDAVTLNARSV